MIDSQQSNLDFGKLHDALRRISTIKQNGRVTQVVGLVIESQGPPAQVGELCYLHISRNQPPVGAEVVGFKENRVLLMPLGDMSGIKPGCEAAASGKFLSVGAGSALLGRVIDGLGNPIDDKGPIFPEKEYPLQNQPPNPLAREDQ